MSVTFLLHKVKVVFPNTSFVCRKTYWFKILFYLFFYFFLLYDH